MLRRKGKEGVRGNEENSRDKRTVLTQPWDERREKKMKPKEKRHECFNMAEEENLSRTKGSSLSQSFRYANRIEVPTFSLRFSLRFGFCARSARLLPLIRAVSTRDTVRTMFPSTLFLFFPILFSAFPLSSSTWAFPPIENNSPTDVR